MIASFSSYQLELQMKQVMVVPICPRSSTSLKPSLLQIHALMSMHCCTLTLSHKGLISYDQNQES